MDPERETIVIKLSVPRETSDEMVEESRRVLEDFLLDDYDGEIVSIEKE